MQAVRHDDDDDDDLTVCKKISMSSFKNVIYKMCFKIMFNIYVQKGFGIK